MCGTSHQNTGAAIDFHDDSCCVVNLEKAIEPLFLG
jgi:hypothetical protein